MRLFQENKLILISILIVLSFFPMITSNLMSYTQISKYDTAIGLNSAEISETSTAFFAQFTDFETTEYIYEAIVADNDDNGIPNLNLLYNNGIYLGEYKR